MTPRMDLIDLPGGPKGAQVPCAVLLPQAEGEGSWPLCLFLHGGNSGREILISYRQLITELWQSGGLPPVVIATPSTGTTSCYLDHPDGSAAWETFVGMRLPELLAGLYPLDGSLWLIGVSMGGYGALKVAFATPEAVRGVVAIEPMLEPGFRAEDVGPRNRFYAFGGYLPAVLHGPARDSNLWARDNPANRACLNAERIRSAGLAIYLEAGNRDSLNFHDGAEFLHRVLWDQDLLHEYRLVDGADHVGASLPGRIRMALEWLGARMASRHEKPLNALEEAWRQWLAGGASGAPPQSSLPSDSEVMRDLLLHNTAEARRKAGIEDRQLARRQGRLPEVNSPPRERQNNQTNQT